MTGPEAPETDPPPLPPVEPASGECCRAGCDPCVYDLYFEALERYERALETWRARQPGSSARELDA